MVAQTQKKKKMKTITFKKQIEVDTTVEFPVITFVAEKVRVSTGDSSWFEMGYIPRYNNLTKRQYHEETGMQYRDIDKMLESYVKETYNTRYGYGQVDIHVYSAKQLSMPELPKVDAKFNDDHADLVKMFSM